MSPANSEEDQTKNFLESYEVDDENISAEDFVRRLVQEGCKYPHDDRSAFLGTKDLPHFYNETMFKNSQYRGTDEVWDPSLAPIKGQDFYQKHIAGIFLGSFLALFAGLALPFGEVLVMTNRSSTPMTAFRRYSATIMHMCTWYESDVKPGSKLWLSVNKVRKMHNAASKQSQSRLNHRLTQYDMSVVIVAFMGIPLLRGKMVGICDVSEDETKCFLHFWRVMGYLFGIEDEFNICKDSVKLTKEITTLLLQKDVIPKMKDGSSHFEILTKAFIEGMNGVLPIFYSDQVLNHVHLVIDSISDSVSFRQLAPARGTSNWNSIRGIVRLMQYDCGRIIMNFILRMTFWLLRVFPVFAYFKFGIKNSHVKI